MTAVTEFKPHNYQSEIINWVTSNRRTAILASMGSGKTVSVLTALDTLSTSEKVYPVLVIAPLRVAKNTWPDEIQKWSHLQHLKCTSITGTLKQRQSALNVQGDVYTTNYENLPWLLEHFGEKWPFKTIVADECTKLKGFRSRQGSVRAKALAKVAHTIVTRMILLTGTPAPNGLLDIWGWCWFVDKGDRLEKSYGRYCEKWFDSDYMGYTLTPKKTAQEEIQNKIKDICLTINTADWVSIDEPIVTNIYVTLPKKVAAQYRAMEKDMFLQLEKEGIEALSAAVTGVKCAQIANGAIYLEDKTWEVLHNEKLRALEDIMEEANGMPVMVAYRFKSDLSRLRSAFPVGKALGDNASDIQDWNAGKIPMLFVHPKSAGHGLNLQDGSNILAFFSIDWNLEEYLQVIERIGPLRQKQSGYKRPVFIYHLLTKETIDELILERLESKRSVQEILLAAMKRHTTGAIPCI